MIEKKTITIDKKHINISVGVAVALLFFIINLTISAAEWKTEMVSAHKEFDDRITHVADKVIDMKQDITDLQLKANNRDIELAQINVKLTNIESLLIELKQQIKEK